MATAAFPSLTPITAEMAGVGLKPPPAVLQRRVIQRRQMLAIQAVSYSLSALVLLIYSYSGTIPVIIPSAYFLSGLMVTGFFAVLSETHVSDRFEDHYLTI